jgi:hypothetical protein
MFWNPDLRKSTSESEEARWKQTVDYFDQVLEFIGSPKVQGMLLKARAFSKMLPTKATSDLGSGADWKMKLLRALRDEGFKVARLVDMSHNPATSTHEALENALLLADRKEQFRWFDLRPMFSKKDGLLHGLLRGTEASVSEQFGGRWGFTNALPGSRLGLALLGHIARQEAKTFHDERDSILADAENGILQLGLTRALAVGHRVPRDKKTVASEAIAALESLPADNFAAGHLIVDKGRISLVAGLRARGGLTQQNRELFEASLAAWPAEALRKIGLHAAIEWGFGKNELRGGFTSLVIGRLATVYEAALNQEQAVWAQDSVDPKLFEDVVNTLLIRIPATGHSPEHPMYFSPSRRASSSLRIPAPAEWRPATGLQVPLLGASVERLARPAIGDDVVEVTQELQAANKAGAPADAALSDAVELVKRAEADEWNESAIGPLLSEMVRYPIVRLSALDSGVETIWHQARDVFDELVRRGTVHASNFRQGKLTDDAVVNGRRVAGRKLFGTLQQAHSKEARVLRTFATMLVDEGYLERVGRGAAEGLIEDEGLWVAEDWVPKLDADGKPVMEVRPGADEGAKPEPIFEPVGKVLLGRALADFNAKFSANVTATDIYDLAERVPSVYETQGRQFYNEKMAPFEGVDAAEDSIRQRQRYVSHAIDSYATAKRREAALKGLTHEEQQSVKRRMAERKGNEETTHAWEREWKTLRAGAEFGVVYKTWDLADGVREWFLETANVALNKMYTSMLASLTTGPGEPVAIFLKRPSGDMDAAPSSISDPTAYRHAQNVANLLNHHFHKLQPEGMSSGQFDLGVFSSHITPKYRVEAHKSPWGQVSEWLTGSEMGAKLSTLGYRELVPRKRDGTFSSSYEAIWVKEDAAYKFLLHLYGQGFEDKIENPAVLKILRGLVQMNQLSKEVAVSISGFHFFAELESWVSSFGLKGILTGRPLWDKEYGLPGVFKMHKRMLDNPESFGDLAVIATEAAPRNIDSESRPLARMLAAMKTFTAKNKALDATAGRAVGLLQYLKDLNDQILWGFVVPVFRMQTAVRLRAEALEAKASGDPRFAGKADQQITQDIVGVVNDVFGGQDFERFLYMTPFVRDMMRLLVFAPDWTISALRQARIPQTIESLTGARTWLSARPDHTTFSADFARMYWPAFLTVVIIGAPAAAQAMIHAWDQALGGDDEDKDHKLWIWDNEEGRRLHVDLTPIWKRLGLGGRGVTGQRRVYTRAGKQAYENLGLIAHPRQYLLGKSSATVKILLEQLVDKNSAWWDMPWVPSGPTEMDAKFHGLFAGAGYRSEDFWSGRIGALLKFFIPMTMQSFLASDSVDFKPFTFATPMSNGMSKTRAQKHLANIFALYADSGAWKGVTASSVQRKHLNALAQNIADALTANGYDAATVFAQARSQVVGYYNRAAFSALNRGDLREFEKNVLRGKRLTTKPGELVDAMEVRFGAMNKRLTPELRAFLREKWGAAPVLP